MITRRESKQLSEYEARMEEMFEQADELFTRLDSALMFLEDIERVIRKQQDEQDVYDELERLMFEGFEVNGDNDTTYPATSVQSIPTGISYLDQERIYMMRQEHRKREEEKRKVEVKNTDDGYVFMPQYREKEVDYGYIKRNR